MTIEMARLPLNAAQDALQAKMLRELGEFFHWLDRTNAKGYLGEVGVSYQVDAASYNAALEKVYYALDKYQMWATAWGAGKWLGTSPLQVYTYNSGTSTWTPTATAEVVERHPTISGVYQRGVNLSGAEYGTDALRPGVEGTNYVHHLQADYDFLATRGIKLIRFPFRWERLQPTLGAALDATYLTALTTQVTRAGNAGMQVILDVHTSGAYFAVDGIERAIGAASGPTSANFADLWTRISNAFQSNATVVAYDLMNEPHLVDTTANWETYAQAAVSAIRTAESTGTHKLIMVPVGEDWTNNPTIEQRHPSGPWITDSASNHYYTSHLYPITSGWENPYSTHNATYQAAGYRREVLGINVDPHDHSDASAIGTPKGKRGGPLKDVTVRGDLKIENNALFPFKAYRFRTSGGALDLEFGGGDLWLSSWSSNAFSSGQVQHIELNHGSSVIKAKQPIEVQKHFRYTAASSQSLATTGGTIAMGSNAETVLPVTTTANTTGTIIAAGATAGQEIIIENRSANTITFNATAATSRVADAAATPTPSIPANRAMSFYWSPDYAGAGAGRWVRLAA